MIQTTKDKSIEHNLSWMLFCHLHVFIYLITLITLTPNRFREYNYRSKTYEKNSLFSRYTNISNSFDLSNKM